MKSYVALLAFGLLILLSSSCFESSPFPLSFRVGSSCHCEAGSNKREYMLHYLKLFPACPRQTYLLFFNTQNVLKVCAFETIFVLENPGAA